MEDEKKQKSKRRWLILLGAHVSLLVYGSTFRSFGVFLVEWRRYFDVSVAEISVIASVLSASVLLSGFFAGPLVARWGCHNTLLIGAIVTVIGTISSTFADSPLVLCFTAGILPGFGVGLIKIAGQVVVAFHFKKGYSRANGFVSAGVALGIMIVPPLIQLCIDQYGWRGALLISAGIQAQVIPAALIARPRCSKKSERNVKNGHRTLASESEEDAMVMEPLNQTGEASNKSSCGGAANATVVQSGDDTKLSLYQSETDENEDAESIHKNEFSKSSSVEYNSLKKENLSHLKDSDGVLETTDECATPKSNSSPSQSHEAVNKNKREHESNEQLPKTLTNNKSSRLGRFFKTSGWPLFRESIGFTLFQICQVTIGLCYSAITAHFVALAVYSGVDEQPASFLLSTLGIASLLARLGNGWVIDLKLILPEYLYALAMLVLGVSMMLTAASQAYGWYIFIALLFGASTGLLKALVPVVMRKFVGKANLAPAMGIFTIFTGIGDFIGPIFAGALYDAKQTYDLPFYVAGSLLTVSSCILLLERPLRRCKERTDGSPSHQAIEHNDSQA